MNSFNINEQYQSYLKTVGLTEENMHPVQKVQLRETFYSAWGQLLALITGDLGKLSKKQAVKTIINMRTQVNLTLKIITEEKILTGIK